MSGELVGAIQQAYLNPDDESLIKKVHACFLRTRLFLPVEVQQASRGDEPKPLYLEDDGQRFIPIFTHVSYLNQWLGEPSLPVEPLSLTGREVVRGTSGDAFVCLDIGQSHYKQFFPQEIERLRLIVQSLDRIAAAGSTTNNTA